MPLQMPDPVPILEQDAYKDVLSRTRNMWEFCLVTQFVSFFGNQLLGLTVSDAFDAEIFEEELLGFPSNPEGANGVLHKVETGLANTLLEPRFRTGSLDGDVAKIYAKKTATSRATDVPYLPLAAVKPEDEQSETERVNFSELGMEDKIRAMAQLVRWISADDNFREWTERVSKKLNPGAKATVMTTNPEQLRIDPVGFSDETSSYLLFDDNRLYVRTETEPDLSAFDAPAPPKKAASKKRSRTGWSGGRKRRRSAHVSSTPEVDDEPEAEAEAVPETRPLTYPEALAQEYEPQWECVCWDLASWQRFIAQLKKQTKKNDVNKRQLYAYLSEEIVPVIEGQEVIRIQAAQARERAREKLMAVANRKRSSRLEEKLVRQKEEDERRLVREAEEQERQRELAERKAKRLRDKAREQRFVDRQHREEERQALIDAGINPDPAPEPEPEPEPQPEVRRTSARAREMQSKHRTVDEATEQIEPVWYFDCVCGKYGENYEDGTLIVECDSCATWMHVEHLTPEEQAVIEADAEKPDGESSQFECSNCKVYKVRYEQEKIRQEQLRVENERREKERLERERLRKERLAKERAERQERERAEKQRQQERERLERIEREQAERQRLAQNQSQPNAQATPVGGHPLWTGNGQGPTPTQSHAYQAHNSSQSQSHVSGLSQAQAQAQTHHVSGNQGYHVFQSGPQPQYSAAAAAAANPTNTALTESKTPAAPTQTPGPTQGPAYSRAAAADAPAYSPSTPSNQDHSQAHQFVQYRSGPTDYPAPPPPLTHPGASYRPASNSHYMSQPPPMTSAAPPAAPPAPQQLAGSPGPMPAYYQQQRPDYSQLANGGRGAGTQAPQGSPMPARPVLGAAQSLQPTPPAPTGAPADQPGAHGNGTPQNGTVGTQKPTTTAEGPEPASL